jgi:hypothetical protein
MREEFVTRVTQLTVNHNGRSRTATARSGKPVKSKPERKVDSLPPLGFDADTFGTPPPHTHTSTFWPSPTLMLAGIPGAAFSPSTHLKS